MEKEKISLNNLSKKEKLALKLKQNLSRRKDKLTHEKIYSNSQTNEDENL